MSEAVWRCRLLSEAFSSEQDDAEANHAARLQLALSNMRAKCATLANEIPASMPHFTQHDVSHMDALWELASLIAGEEVHLNPAEAFVLGASMLVHDLAMSQAANTLMGINLRDDPRWPDALADRLRVRYHRAPGTADLVSPPEDVAREVEQSLIRISHAERAESLPTAGWPTLDGSTDYLIDNHELRGTFGRLIGQIAASHHWDSSVLNDRLGSLVGAAPAMPAGWTVDPVKLACLLRAADAAHLDGSRAPALLAHVRDITGYSRQHWLFQSKLQRPFLREGRLVFSATAGFDRSEIDSWWLAYDTLKMVDSELRAVDNLLADAKGQRFAARAVAFVDSPSAFEKTAPCLSWKPVPARVHVSDVAGLVSRLGGAELYGEDSLLAALREVVVNACDAVKAREALAQYKGREWRSGKVLVRTVNADGCWLEICDNGIGMSAETLSDALLDFGRSSWLAEGVVGQNPGLSASSFSPQGRYGIGFFAIFLLGERVQVVSRALRASERDTWVLEFVHGAAAQPIIRLADEGEVLEEAGTIVRVKLREGLGVDGDIRVNLASQPSGGWARQWRGSLEESLRFMLPATPVDIWLEESGVQRQLMVANDWQTMPGPLLLERIIGGREGPYREFWPLLVELGERLETIFDGNGKVVARIALLGKDAIEKIGWAGGELSVVTAGAARTGTSLSGVAGLLLGMPERASRDAAVPDLREDDLSLWASRACLDIVRAAADCSGNWAWELAGAVDEVGGDARPVACWLVEGNWVDWATFSAWSRAFDEVLVVHPLYIEVRKGREVTPIEVGKGVVCFEVGRRMPLINNRSSSWPHHRIEENFHEYGRPGLFLKGLAEAWKCTPQELLPGFGDPEYRQIGLHDGDPVGADVYVFRRP